MASLCERICIFEWDSSFQRPKINKSFTLSYMEQIILVYSGMEGYLDNLEVSQIADFKEFLLNKVSAKNSWLANLDINKKIQGIALDFFLRETLTEFKNN